MATFLHVTANQIILLKNCVLIATCSIVANDLDHDLDQGHYLLIPRKHQECHHKEQQLPSFLVMYIQPLKHC